MRDRPGKHPIQTSSGSTQGKPPAVPVSRNTAAGPLPPAGTPGGWPGVYVQPPPNVRRQGFTLPRQPPVLRAATVRPRFLIGERPTHGRESKAETTSSP